ncbi:VanZ family protein [Hydrogenophaga sp.]|uniref:VanZ family protein n=1 Tax=Hydrogenophaga sp. TaxID=1904254 RepID=UPI003D139A9A
MSLIKPVFWLSVLALAVASLVPGELLPEQSFNVWDKAQHVAGFAWLGLLGLFSHPRHPSRLALSLLAFGAFIELAQTATGWRFGEWLDLLADGVGILLGMAAWTLVRAARPPTP